MCNVVMVNVKKKESRLFLLVTTKCIDLKRIILLHVYLVYITGGLETF